jgi:hypothetical protein
MMLDDSTNGVRARVDVESIANAARAINQFGALLRLKLEFAAPPGFKITA